MKSLPTTYVLGLTALAIGLVGCNGDTATSGPETQAPPATVDAHAGHDHPSEGPHHGDLIELGNEEYHAELVHPHGHDEDGHAHDEDHKEGDHKDGDHDHADDGLGIVIYVLDGSAKTAVPIEAADVTINLSHDGKPEQFKLAAMPDEGDPAGKSSRFTSADKDLLEHFEEEGVEGTLVLMIAGKSYRGEISHDHDHDHDHAHE